LEIHGTKYHQKDVVIHSFDNDEPVLATISHFISTKTEHFFVLNFLRVLGYCYHYHAYKVDTSSTEIHVCTQADLKDHHPLSVVSTFDNTLSNNTFVPLKYRVF
jgi:hypothetical protein